MSTSFAISDEDEFLKELESAKSFLVIGDNVGRTYFPIKPYY